MRISDWSSDVCSSDLLTQQAFPRRHIGQGKRIEGAPDTLQRRLNMRQRAAQRIGAGDLMRLQPRPIEVLQLQMQDRKSVVEGKSVSVRVDLGGRRIIQKQK